MGDASGLIQTAVHGSHLSPSQESDDNPLGILVEELRRFTGPEGAIERKLMNQTMNSIVQQLQNQTAATAPQPNPLPPVRAPPAPQPPQPSEQRPVREPPRLPRPSGDDRGNPLRMLAEELGRFNRPDGEVERRLMNETMRGIWQQLQNQTNSAAPRQQASPSKALPFWAPQGPSPRQPQQPAAQPTGPPQPLALPVAQERPQPPRPSSSGGDNPVRLLVEQLQRFGSPGGATGRSPMDEAARGVQQQPKDRTQIQAAVAAPQPGPSLSGDAPQGTQSRAPVAPSAGPPLLPKPHVAKDPLSIIADQFWNILKNAPGKRS